MPLTSARVVGYAAAMLFPRRLPACLAVLASVSSLHAAGDPFAEGVRPTDPVAPGAQSKTFHLPPGFEIQLFAAEPQINKPINMAFDVKGRLWVTSNFEYPFAVPKDRFDPATGRTRGSKDRIVILEDTDGDGRADKSTTFADELNIPTGVLPYGNGCLAWSIPNLWYFEDTNGDGVCDKRSVVFGPLGWEKDTHGNVSSYRRGPDGWVYATHGFNNTSHFAARDGSTLDVNSGNTFRFRPDGSRVEGHTWGQVNPFGLAWDARGNLYSADCHSSPIYQLLRGAFYPSFGKPHDGLGFGPVTIQHTHGSTAICAPLYIHDPAWPKDLQDHVLIGNVMTSRINHDLITWKGASSKGTELPDFLKTDDPWFRPVDLQWGPDSALYVADFYNKIIGHYEVPLTHPGRDHERGRIWRIVYRGEKKGSAPKLAPLPETAEGLFEELGSSNPTRRMLALNELCDRHAAKVPDLAKRPANPGNPFREAFTLWALHRVDRLDDARLLSGMGASDPIVRTHALRIAGERSVWPGDLIAGVRKALKDQDGIVARVAAEALGNHPSEENFRPLYDRLSATPAEDDHLRHSLRIALRDQLAHPEVASRITLQDFDAPALSAILDVMLAVPGEQTALLRLTLFERIEVPPDVLAKQLPSLARNLPPDRLDSLAAIAQKKLVGNLDAQSATAQNLLDALAQRGMKPGAALAEWGGELATQLLAKRGEQGGWTFTNLDGSIAEKNPWAFQERPSADGQKVQLLSSHPRGEQLTGLLRSAPFAAPEKLRFYLSGHDGAPDQALGKNNAVRLRDADTRAVLREASPPRNDTAQRIEWNLADVQGRRVVFEVADGNTAPAYAWLAVGRFQPELPELTLADPASNTRRAALAADLARTLRLVGLAPQLASLFNDQQAEADTRLAAARALVACDADPTPIAAAVADTFAPLTLREQLAGVLGQKAGVAPALVTVLKTAPHRLQQAIALALATSPTGCSALLDAVASGQASPTLLRDRALVDRLRAAKIGDLEKRLAVLTANLPPANEQMEKQLTMRRDAFASGKPDAKRGADVFRRNCVACHRVGAEGGLVGPQLDGIGNRGLERIIEDVLDPNRNVDAAFRTQTITRKDGTVATGLFRREEGAQLILADFAGKEFPIAKDDVQSRSESETSLMPPSLGDIMPATEFNDLIAYLLSQRSEK
ncbi:MAG TPA: PVC-type heme-binding CxxCH protein [Chthoniobacteraceae bacterium]|nr:PVC-type heme-binding CxxCH protein [Chthoniobacteraceae bacterium]